MPSTGRLNRLPRSEPAKRDANILGPGSGENGGKAQNQHDSQLRNSPWPNTTHTSSPRFAFLCWVSVRVGTGGCRGRVVRS